MEVVQYVRKTDLARNTRQIIRDVLRGKTAVIESHGQAEVAIIDVIDYRIQRALIRYYTQKQPIGEAHDFSDQAFAGVTDEQERYDRVMAFYLTEQVSLSRTAELLSLPALDLRIRFARLNIPLRQGTTSTEEADEDVQNALSWAG
jgi:predicted HTH domain antitoxin